MLGFLRGRSSAAAPPAWLTELPAAVSDGLYVLDHRFRFTFINSVAEAFWERAASSLMNRSIWDMFPDAVGSGFHSAHLGALRDRQPMKFKEPHAGDRWVEGKAHPHHGGLLVLFRDITHRRRKTASLVECRARVAALFDQSAVGMAEASVTGELRRVNAPFGRAFGQATDVLAGVGLTDILPGAAARLARVAETGELDVAEVRVDRPGGRPAWIETMIAPVRDRDGQVASLIVTVHDLTHRRAAEDALRSLAASLEERVAGALAERAGVEESLRQAQKMEALGQLAGGVAHDFNNVLQAIIGGAQLIRRRPGEAEQVERLAGLIVDAADRGAAVTRRLLSFARRDALQAEPVEARPMLDDLADVLAHTLGRGIAVRAEAAERLVTLADRGQLETVLVNLATNARDAMPEGGTLVLGAAAERVATGLAHRAALRPGDYVRFSARDSGTGMDAETLLHAAEPFFTTKPRGKGTGLGLSQARGFAEQSGGGLAISSAPGEGTTVDLWLPVARDGAEEVTKDSPLPPRTRVLLVDDDAVVRDVLAEELRQMGCDVLTRDGAEPALATLREGAAVDLLVSDLSMPGTDGLTTIREAQRLRPGLPAVLLTGYAGEGLEIAMGDVFEAPITLLRKPVSAAGLAAAVGALLFRSRSRSPG